MDRSAQHRKPADPLSGRARPRPRRRADVLRPTPSLISAAACSGSRPRSSPIWASRRSCTWRSVSPTGSRSRRPCSRRDSSCGRSSSSTTAPTAPTCAHERANDWLGRARPARPLALLELADQARPASCDRRRPRPSRWRRRDDDDLAEYAALSAKGRLGYRLFRNPLVMFGLGPIFALLIGPRHRPRDGASPHRAAASSCDQRGVVRRVWRPLLADGLAGLPARPGGHR